MLKAAAIAVCIAALALSGCMMPSHEQSVAYNETKLVKEGLVRPKIGDSAPPFSTQDATGQAITLQGMIGDGKYAVLFFYPVNGTPNTAKHIMALAKAAPALAAQKVSVYAVNPGAPADGLAFLKSYSVSLPLLDDPGQAIARQYGCALKTDSYPQRTLVGIGPDGKILMYYRGFFPGPDPTQSILRELGLVTKGNAAPGAAAPGAGAPATSTPGAAAPPATAPPTATPPATTPAPAPPGKTAPAPGKPGSGAPGK
jgi:thioredoxin-dependent peroxiredoxin